MRSLRVGSYIPPSTMSVLIKFVPHLALIYVLVSDSTCTRKSTSEQEFAWKQNYIAWKACRCGRSKPSIVDVIPDYIKHRYKGAKILPPAAVLHRCDHSCNFCFNVDRECVPSVLEWVNLTFQIRRMGTWKVEFYHKKAENHTACECRSKTNPR